MNELLDLLFDGHGCFDCRHRYVCNDKKTCIQWEADMDSEEELLKMVQKELRKAITDHLQRQGKTT